MQSDHTGPPQKLNDMLFGKAAFDVEHAIGMYVTKTIGFEVKYIGQAYGDAGSRNALDRLLKHETLQKIALNGAPNG